MARYYFDIMDEEGIFLDDEGIDLPNMDSAIKEARRALADMVRDALRAQNPDSVSISIRDGAEGPIVLSVTLKTEEPNG